MKGEFLPECEDEWTRSKRLGRQVKMATAPLVQLLEWYEAKDPDRAAQILSDAWELAMMLDPGQLRYMTERFVGDGLSPGARLRLDFLRSYASFVNTDYELAQTRLRDVIRRAFSQDEVPLALVAGQWLSLSEMETFGLRPGRPHHEVGLEARLASRGCR